MESYPPSRAADRPPKLDVAVTEDGLEAYVQPLPDVPVNVGDVLHALAYYSVVQGIDGSLVAEVARSNDSEKPRLVARGRAAVPGRDASVEYFFETKTSSVLANPIDADDVLESTGNLNFRSGKILANVQPGDVLATKIPAMAGTAGNSVFGTPLPAPHGKDVPFAIGRNVRFGDDELSVIARLSGTPMVERDGKISVLDTYVVKEVNLATGNISHIGNVRVDGDVLSGFVVEATGDIEVNGNVEGASLFAGRNLMVRGGMRGHAKGDAAGDVTVRFVDPDCSIKAKGKVSVERNCIQGHIEALEKISVGGNLIGGSVKSAMSIDAAIVGSSGGITTTLEIDHTISEALLALLREDLDLMENGREKRDSMPPSSEFVEDELEPAPLTQQSPVSSSVHGSAPPTQRSNSLPPRTSVLPPRPSIPPGATTLSRMKAAIPGAPRAPSLPPRPGPASVSRIPAAPMRTASSGPQSVRPGPPLAGPQSVRPPAPAGPQSVRPGASPSSMRPPGSIPPPSMAGGARPSVGVLKIAKGAPPQSLRAQASSTAPPREHEKVLSPAEIARKQMSDLVLHHQHMNAMRKHIVFLEREIASRTKGPGRVTCRQNCFVGVRIVIDHVEHRVLADGFGTTFFLRGEKVQEAKLLV